MGCVIFELFTSKILFPGKSNNEMLRCFMDLKGPFPKKMVKRGAFHEKHFESDPNMSFSLEEEDPIDHRRVSLYLICCKFGLFVRLKLGVHHPLSFHWDFFS